MNKHAELEAQQGEPVKLQHMAVAEGGELRWMTGRQVESCELYAMPDLGRAPKLYTSTHPAQDVSGLVDALRHARQFIVNGVDLGFIRMPDADTPDPAHKTLPLIDEALAAHRAKQGGGA